MLEHELRGLFDELTRPLAREIAEHLDGRIRLIIQTELKPMVDAVADLKTETDLVLSDIQTLASTLQADIAALAAQPNLTPAIEAQIARLKSGTDAVAALVSSVTPVTVPPASPVASPAPVASPVASPAPTAPAPTPLPPTA